MLDRNYKTSLRWHRWREDDPLHYVFKITSTNAYGLDDQDHTGFNHLEPHQARLLAAGLSIDRLSPRLMVEPKEGAHLTLRQINHGAPVHQWLMEARSGDEVTEIGVMDSATVRLLNAASKGTIELPELLVLEGQMSKLAFADEPDEEAISDLQSKIDELNPPVAESSPGL